MVPSLLAGVFGWRTRASNSSNSQTRLQHTRTPPYLKRLELILLVLLITALHSLFLPKLPVGDLGRPRPAAQSSQLPSHGHVQHGPPQNRSRDPYSRKIRIRVTAAQQRLLSTFSILCRYDDWLPSQVARLDLDIHFGGVQEIRWVENACLKRAVHRALRYRFGHGSTGRASLGESGFISRSAETMSNLNRQSKRSPSMSTESIKSMKNCRYLNVWVHIGISRCLDNLNP